MSPDEQPPDPAVVATGRTLDRAVRRLDALEAVVRAVVDNLASVRASTSTSRSTPRPPEPAPSRRSSTGASTKRVCGSSATIVRICVANGSAKRWSISSFGARRGSSANSYGFVEYVGLRLCAARSCSGNTQALMPRSANAETMSASTVR